jgi:hypothetical protein
MGGQCTWWPITGHMLWYTRSSSSRPSARRSAMIATGTAIRAA